jgi:hypothetical protein
MDIRRSQYDKNLRNIFGHVRLFEVLYVLRVTTLLKGTNICEQLFSEIKLDKINLKIDSVAILESCIRVARSESGKLDADILTAFRIKLLKNNMCIFVAIILIIFAA